MGDGQAPAAEYQDTDILSDVLEAVRLTGALFFVVDASPPWVAAAPEASVLAPAILPRVQHVISYHVVTRGSCWCEMPGSAPARLDTGDAIVIPRGDEYTLSSPAGVASGLTPEDTLTWFRLMASGQLPFVVREGGAGPDRLNVICGFLGCDSLPFHPVFAALPRMLHVRGAYARDASQLRTLAEVAVGEARDKRAGSRSVLVRIGELMFVEVLRRYLTSLTPEADGWLAGLRDPLVGQTLAQLHRQPSRSWTVEDLAREVASSRSVLAERFTHFVGEPPMHYLTRWRMQLAARRLADNAAKVSAVAQEVGYDSEAAFSRAFKKATGVAPGQWRSRGRAAG